MVKKITQKPVNVTANEVSAYLKAQGKYVRAKRKELRLTQAELGEIIGADQSLIAKAECGVANFSTRTYLAVMKALQIDQRQLADYMQIKMDMFQLLESDQNPAKQIRAIKKMLKLPKTTPNEIVLVELAKRALL